MKKILSVIIIIIMLILETYTSVYATGRLVDIPIPPDNHGMLDSTEKEASKSQIQNDENTTDKEVQENIITNENITEQVKEENNSVNKYVGKSVNNYLKSLSVVGYKLTPEFIRENSTYTIYVKDRSKVTSLNILAESDDDTAKIEGIGQVEINPEQKSVNIQVTAENGNLKIYTINIENEENKQESSNIYIRLLFGICLIFIIILFVIFIMKSKKNYKK